MIEKLKHGYAPSFVTALVIFEWVGVPWYQCMVADAQWEDSPEETLDEWMNGTDDAVLSICEYATSNFSERCPKRFKNPEWFYPCLDGRALNKRGDLHRFTGRDFSYLNELLFV